MNRKLTVTLLLGAILVLTIFSPTACTEEASKSDNTIPAELEWVT